ncbi:MAG: hypothetical protein CSA09_02080 [Candidatus Contendobacter odensis]|uniref:AI-2E family transporter n=1 Tax=Candidatus Contendibacter odensensis TaxID=1400860 RepID=A0A2G6PFL2_9GAMM|nr:MAG: hypothetical protein CSA09_02080 [Candidatus Contendobacter odensis]
MSKRFILFGLLGSIASMLFIFQHYLLPISVGLVLTLATSPLYESLDKKIASPYKTLYIASTLTATLFLIVFLPLIYFAGTSYQYLPKIDMDKMLAYTSIIIDNLKNLPAPITILQEPVNAFLEKFRIEGNSLNLLQVILSYAASMLAKINNMTYKFFLILFFYFIFNTYSKKIYIYTMELIPLGKINKRILFQELTNNISSVFFGNLFSMIFQGIAFGLFIYLTTDYDALYVGLMVAFTTAIPIIGTYLVAVPIAILEIIDGNTVFAVTIILFAIIVLSGIIDNILRLIFMNKVSKKFCLEYSINELFVLISMIAGISVFGGWGIILAPAILSLNLTFIDMYKLSQRRRSII